MKKIILIVCSLLSLVCAAQEYLPKKSLPIIPLPKEIKTSDGSFVLTAQTKIVLINDVKAFQPEVDYINQYFKTNYDFELPVVMTLPSDDNYIMFIRPENKTGQLENYELSVNKNQIRLSAEGNAGMFYGLQTLIQILPLQKATEVKIPCVQMFI